MKSTVSESINGFRYLYTSELLNADIPTYSCLVSHVKQQNNLNASFLTYTIYNFVHAPIYQNLY